MSDQENRFARALESPLTEGRSALVNAEADDVLPALVRLAESRFRVALVDPPYNRRTRFHHYSDSVERDNWAVERERQAAMLRLLLTDAGSLWMHIDDAEMPTARHVLDRVFGPANFVATIVWQKSVSRDNRVDIATTHEYVLVYAKERQKFRVASHRLPVTNAQLGRYKNPDGDPRGAWTSGDLTAKAGPGRRSEQFYDIALPSGRVVRPSNGTAWRYTRERFDELVADNRIDFGNGDKMPRLKRFLSETDAGLVPDTWWPGEVVGTADTAKRHLKAMFPALIPFETPKPEPLAERILTIASDPEDLVVDCYAGSGTTAAVAHKMGRRFIAIERESRTFCEFTLPRLEMVDRGSDPGGIAPASHTRIGSGFQVIGTSEV